MLGRATSTIVVAIVKRVVLMPTARVIKALLVEDMAQGSGCLFELLKI
tara:strand:+ start:1246 stop:1389 length:144 start_codon:yes stop_codon:yes gene_type:complete